MFFNCSRLNQYFQAQGLTLILQKTINKNYPSVHKKGQIDSTPKRHPIPWKHSTFCVVFIVAFRAN